MFCLPIQNGVNMFLGTSTPFFGGMAKLKTGIFLFAETATSGKIMIFLV